MNKIALRRTLIGVAVVAAGLIAYRAFGWGAMGPVNALRLDLAAPDALIVSKSLSSLPRDLLTIPLARDVLREDFLFYYEQSEDRLGLQGSLRRIAYEHELGWGDELIRMVLDEPAEVALWRDADGSLKHFAIAATRSKLGRVLEEAAKVALKDKQMTVAGELNVDGDKVPVYALSYAWNRRLLFAARGNRIVILSNPGMLYGGGENAQRSEKSAETVLADMLTADPKRQQLMRQRFHLENAASDGHSVAIKADFLSFSYQPFFGALEALRFDFDRQGWKTRALINGPAIKAGAYDNRALWPALPYNPAACFSVPVDWAALQPVADQVGVPAGTVLANELSGPGAVCWYGQSSLYTPVFVATRKNANADGKALYEALFEKIVGRADSGAVQKKAGKKGETILQRSVKRPQGEQQATLALSGRTVVFSPDGALAAKVLAVLAKQAPAASDGLPDPARTIGLIAPASLATLIEREAFASLPAATEPVLRGAADAHLLPRLKALKTYPAYRLVLGGSPGAATAWQPVEWQSLGR
ncbi:DUF2138 family protein [Oxalobacteraceae bacterium]|nr:DUF2138 family protein [Oxalobacteraceae bacterium]